MVKVIATDLDGTLLAPKRVFSLVASENKKFINNYYGDIVLVSGRNPRFCAKICNKLNIHHNFIALNGAVVVKEGNVIYNQSMKKVALTALLEFLEHYYTDFELMIFTEYDEILSYSPCSVSKLKRKHFKHWLKNFRLHEKIIINKKKFLKYLNDDTAICKAIVYSPNSDDLYSLISKEFKSHFSFFCCSTSVEISPIGVNKGKALEYLINTTNLTKDDVAFVGDSANDIPAFELFKNSYVMDSARTYVKAKAKHSIKKFSDLSKYTSVKNNFKED